MMISIQRREHLVKIGDGANHVGGEEALHLLGLFEQRRGAVFEFAIPAFDHEQLGFRLGDGALHSQHGHVVERHGFVKFRKGGVEQFLFGFLQFPGAAAEFLFPDHALRVLQPQPHVRHFVTDGVHHRSRLTQKNDQISAKRRDGFNGGNLGFIRHASTLVQILLDALRLAQQERRVFF